MFGKIQVLESKLDIYEDLSKEMLNKLENAVATISENSNRVAIVLERHENRLDEGDKANEAILSLIKRVEHNLEDLEKKVDALSRFRWTIAGIGMSLVIALQIPNFLTIAQDSSRLERQTAPLVNGSNRQ
jgi:DNA repair exonuclease SbcCD ATPase subunit